MPQACPCCGAQWLGDNVLLQPGQTPSVIERQRFYVCSTSLFAQREDGGGIRVVAGCVNAVQEKVEAHGR